MVGLDVCARRPQEPGGGRVGASGSGQSTQRGLDAHPPPLTAQGPPCSGCSCAPGARCARVCVHANPVQGSGTPVTPSPLGPSP